MMSIPISSGYEIREGKDNSSTDPEWFLAFEDPEGGGICDCVVGAPVTAAFGNPAVNLCTSFRLT